MLPCIIRIVGDGQFDCSLCCGEQTILLSCYNDAFIWELRINRLWGMNYTITLKVRYKVVGCMCIERVSECTCYVHV